MNRRLIPILSLFLFLSGCNRIYYASMQKLGTEKRDILVKRIIEGKKEQDLAKEQVKTTLEAFQELTGFEGGNLEKTYKKLNSELEHSQDRADKLSSKIKSIDQVANDLFAEWQKEIDGMGDRTLKSKSGSMLRDTRLRHAEYMKRMHRTEQKLQPVLQAFRDQVLFLKHNLNAHAIQSLKQTAASIDKDVSSLIQDIEISSQEADKFIGSLSSVSTS
jgi:hypothetical protein